MNKDLISRDALKEALNEIFDTVEVVTFDDIIDIIDNAPTVEQPTGEWETFEKCGMWHFLCRKCHHAYTVKYNFCPHCGEKKEGGEGE